MYLFIDILKMLHHESFFFFDAGARYRLVVNPKYACIFISLIAEVAASWGPGEGVALRLWFCGLNAV